MFKHCVIIVGVALAILLPEPAEAQSTAPGQAKADYYAWLARSPQKRDNVRAFQAYLEQRRVSDVLPTWQLVRTSSSWRECSAERFEVAPVQQWRNIFHTLSFVKNEVVPAVGTVEALSAYRNEKLNSCSGGRPGSAHRMFFAMDLVPADDIERAVMISQLCEAHAEDGATYKIGLGFYTGLRFHVDSNGFRKWGADGRGTTSPCNRAG